MKRNRSDSDSESSDHYHPDDRQKVIPLGKTLGAEDQKIFDSLKTLNNQHHLWTAFTRKQQQVFSEAFDSISKETFDDLKATYNTAGNQYRVDEEIAKANNAHVLTNYVPSGKHTDKLVVMFMNIGSGDCIFIQTPKGKTIVVDCGQRATPKLRPKYRTEIQDMLKGPLFLDGQNKSLYALILTHPDQDHYNEVTEIIKPSVTHVEHAFYTLSKADYSEKATNPTSTNNETTKTYLNKARILNKVTINSSGAALETSENNGWKTLYDVGFGKNKNENKIQILGKHATRANWDEDNCSIYLLAAEVPPTHKDTKPNAASIVTLIEAYNRKILLCGDATYSTETFLLEEHPEIVKNIDLAQLEHHGSGTEHASDEFVKKINPVLAAASSGPHKLDMNPRWVTIDKFVNPTTLGVNSNKRRICKEMDEHTIKYATDNGWTDRNTNNWQKTYKKYGLFTTESNNDLCFMIDKDGNLIREYSDATNTYTYKIDAGGKVTTTTTPLTKKSTS
ncbi:MAG TPA: MBL fold metallo-hydrolase [Blastocatellia bacterium]|nr:MBL fold metallo-hydrolase [Blastocatellia bacterium]